ncbi:hypothetical protein [Salinarchaeum laminariae]|uniref:hypothetical protein n=1 Tax=Salinarchaeum laminariae TaxID=869888 RepID=UPI0020C01C82|nr:hypothetical protein [Salinarchaeum laminariae]
MSLERTMTSQSSLLCPWCEHESTDANAFRTHLMVQHRKSDLATYVLHDVDGERESTEAVLQP